MRPLRGSLLRRCVHTQNVRPKPRARMAFIAAGSVLATTAYVAWQTSFSQRVHLDAPTKPNIQSTPETRRPLADSTLEPSSAAEEGARLVETKEEEAEEEAEEAADSQGGAFNPETGEINWDCPCLGGMAHGPCGPQFREAFSCFVFSEDEPKGINCVEKFKHMQDCFREHPEVYGEEIMQDDDEELETDAGEGSSSASSGSAADPASTSNHISSPTDGAKDTST